MFYFQPANPVGGRHLNLIYSRPVMETVGI